MDGDFGVMVVGYKHHWELLELSAGQVEAANEILYRNSTKKKIIIASI